MVAILPVFKIKIKNEEIVDILTEINGVTPTRWFIVKNGSDNKKDVFAYIINNTSEYIQLVPLKGNKKQGVVDKCNIITLNKLTDIEKCVVVKTDYYKIKIKLKNGVRFTFIAFSLGSSKQQKESIKLFKNEYKKASKSAQALWNTIIALYLVLCAIIGFVIGYNYSDYIFPSETIDGYSVNEIEKDFNKRIKDINSTEYKDIFSIHTEPYSSNAVITGDTKTVKINSFQFTVNADAEFQQFDTGDYSYLFSSDDKIIGAGYVDTYRTEHNVKNMQDVMYQHIKGGTLEKMGYSMASWFDIKKSSYSIDYFSDDIKNFNFYEKLLFITMVEDRLNYATEKNRLLAVYEKEFDEYYMIIKKVQHNDMADDVVYSYDIDVYFKDDLNTFESYSVTNLNGTEEECFAIINSMKLIEKQ